MKHVARACAIVAPLCWACSSYDYEGMALVSPLDAIVVGDTVTLSVFASDGSMPSGPSVRWTSSDTSVATVDELGVITGTGPGRVLIVARTGDYRLEVPLRVWTTAGPFLSIEAGVDHGCGLTDDGAAWCWGSNQHDQLGPPVFPDICFITRDAYLPCSLGAIPVSTEARFTELAIGSYHSCGLSTAGIAYCWGSNDHGQLGDGETATRPTPREVASGHVFRMLIAGARTTCGITSDEELLCWGRGLLRVDGNAGDSLTMPTPVATGQRFALAAMGGSHVCGVAPVGVTYCWGSNSHGQLGVAHTDSTCGSLPCAREPQEVAGAPPFVELALGREFSCGLTAAGDAYCWGGNDLGQLGDGTRTGRWDAMPVTGGHTFVDLAAEGSGACGLDGSGLLFCWGSPPAGFGDDGDLTEADRPTRAAAGLRFATLSLGAGTQCGVTDSGVTWCWGSNLLGALGNGRTHRVPLTTPTRVIRHPGY